MSAFLLVVALHAGGGFYMLATPDLPDGNTDDAIAVELVPDPSDQDAKPDDLAGPKVADSAAPISEQTQADDPDPPAPDSAPPTETKTQPDAAPEATAPPAPADAEAVLPPQEKKPEDKPPDPKPPEQKPEEKLPEAKPDKVERQTAPSQASSGSAPLLGGGRRPSAAAKATWAGEIGTHLVHLRRYPRAARAAGWQGTARVRVTIDGDGHVLGHELVKSSGRPVLDDEALALMDRSDPFPKPPAGMPTPIALTVPVNFSIR